MAEDDKKTSTFTPERKSIGDLLAMSGPNVEVPSWQRNYSWLAEQVRSFWEDLERFVSVEIPAGKQEYFLGSIVVVNTNDNKRRLLDGQQRLATAAILLSVFRDHFVGIDKAVATQIQKNYLSDYDALKGKRIHKLQLNRYDGEFFRKLISSDRIENEDYVEPTPAIASHHLILNARKLLERLLAEEVAGMAAPAARAKITSKVQALLERFVVIAVFSNDEEYAGDLFETLNDRGIGLASTDLLKNLLLKRAAVGDQEAIEECFNKVFSFDKETEIQTFLRHFWTSNYGDVKSHKLYKVMKEKITGKPIDSLVLATRLAASSESYKILTSASTESVSLNAALEQLFEFGSKTNILLPAILAVYETKEAEVTERFVEFLRNFFVRYSIIQGQENSPFEVKMYSGSTQFRADGNVESFASSIRALASSEQILKDQFKALSIRSTAISRPLLKKFEMHFRKTEELHLATAKKVHVEHIYPQNPEEGEKWPQHEKYVYRLGNQTLLYSRLNQQAQNFKFETKLGLYKDSDLELVKQLLVNTTWGVQEIDERQAQMAELVPVLWPIDGIIEE